jgi:hypothetical protein
VLLKLAKSAGKLYGHQQAVGFLRQILDVDPRNGFAYLDLERVLQGPSAGTTWSASDDTPTPGAAGHRPTEPRCVAIADIWGGSGLPRRRRGAEGPGGGARQRPAPLSAARLTAQRWAMARLERSAAGGAGAGRGSTSATRGSCAPKGADGSMPS